MMGKKLAEQQKEILREMNKKDVDAILDRHKKQLLAMEEALGKEQQRQMKKMREKMQGKNQEAMKEKMLRQIKMAEIQKKKKAELEAVKDDAMNSQDLEKALQGQPNVKLEVCMQKVNIYSKMAYKHGYSHKTQPKKHLIKMRELNDFLGRYLLHQETPDVESVSSRSSEANREIEGMMKKEARLTYKTLLDHIEIAERNYEDTRVNSGAVRQIGRRVTQGSTNDRDAMSASAASGYRPRSSISRKF
jgi:hypothetical protein